MEQSDSDQKVLGEGENGGKKGKGRSKNMYE